MGADTLGCIMARCSEAVSSGLLLLESVPACASAWVETLNPENGPRRLSLAVCPSPPEK